MKRLGGILLSLWLIITGLTETIVCFDIFTIPDSALDIIIKGAPILAIAAGVFLLVGYLTER